MIASLLKFPGLFSVFWTILVMLLSRWSLIILLLLSFPVPLPILLWLFQVHQPQVVSPLPSCSVVFFYSLDAYLSFPFLYLHSLVCRDNKVQYSADSLFLLTIARFDRLVEIKWSICITESQGSLWVSFSRTDTGLWIYHLFIWSNLIFFHNSQ